MKRQWGAAALALCLLLSACGQTGQNGQEDGGASSSLTASQLAAQRGLSQQLLFSDRDYGESDEIDCAITLADGGSEIDGAGAAVHGDTVTISQQGCYQLTGALSDGQIVVDAADSANIQLVLDGVSVTSQDSAALYIKEADQVFLTLAEGCDNAFSSAGEYVQKDENNVDGAIFSKSDLSLGGSGALSLTSHSGHGIVSKDDLIVTGGAYTIQAAGHALSGKDSVRIAGGTFAITAGKDGLHSDNEEDATLGFVYLCGGRFAIDAADDGVHASSLLVVEGAKSSSPRAMRDWRARAFSSPAARSLLSAPTTASTPPAALTTRAASQTAPSPRRRSAALKSPAARYPSTLRATASTPTARC